MKWLLPVLAVLLGKAIPVFAAPNPVIYRATGLTPADIQPLVDQFRRDISRGGVDNGNLSGPLPNGRREIDWENPMGNGFISFPEKGALFHTGPFFSLRVSNDAPPLNFSDIDPSYLTTFTPFGSARMVANETFPGDIGVAFGIPSVDATFSENHFVNAVGIVFSDVDLPDSSYVNLSIDGTYGLSFEVPARSGDGTLSFLGISFEDQNLIYGLVIRPGNAGLAPGLKDGAIRRDPFSGQETLVDLVTIDRVIFGEPSTVPEPSTIAMLAVGLLILATRIKARHCP